jgi:hypothetical protein
MRSPPLRKLIPAAIVFVILAYSGWWWFTARAFARQVDRWIAAEQAKGAEIVPAEITVGGYPFGFTIVLDNAALSWPSGFGFRAQTAKVTARPWALEHLGVSVGHGFAVALPPGTARPAITLAGETLRGKAVFADTPVPLLLDLSADTVSATTAIAGGDPAREMTIATVAITLTRPETPPATDTDVAYALSLHLIDLSSPAIEGNPLGATIADTVVEARLLGVPPVTPDAAGLKAWRDSGGTVDASSLLLRWGPLTLTGNGTLALDAAMQPEGAFTVHLSGFEPAIDALTSAGWLKPGPAGYAKLGLGLVSQPGPDGKPVATTPLSIQNRKISAGAIKLGEVPEVKVE